MNGSQLHLETDALVIGAGPAGCACAIQLLKQGKQVVIIDRATFPRQAPGETLHPGIQPLLEQLGVMDQALKNTTSRHNGIDNVVDGQTSFTPYSETENWQGFQFLRSSFDHMLAKEAQRLGASVHFQVLPRDLSKDKDGNITEVSGANFTVRSSFVIDATGRRRWMARHLSLQHDEFSPKLLAWYGYVECRNSSTFRIPKFIWTAKGWIWLADVGDGRISWACLDVINQKRRRIDWIPEQLRHCRALDKTRGIDVTWSIATELSGNNWFLVGDAAVVLDPSSSHGILKAIMSGIMVSHLIGKYSKSNQPLIHRHYDQWARDLFLSDSKEMKQMYASHIDGFKNHWRL